MTKGELESLHHDLQEKVTARRRLGAYNADAETILTMMETMLKLVHHLREKAR